ncbi:MAG: hypothetical protein KTR16_15765, partial [Acidiferrobacterales bacterium]|nr:hypothetical protein [Acidiferrobacterales bacterium]
MKFSKTCGILAVSMTSLVANPALHANDLTEIIVTAKGEQSLADVLPTSHVYTAQDISAAQAVDLPSLLDEIGGVSIAPTGGRGTVTGLFL